jgi:hypothetical protein
VFIFLNFIVQGPQYNETMFFSNGFKYIQYSFCRPHSTFEHLPGFIVGAVHRWIHHILRFTRSIFISTNSRQADDACKYSGRVKNVEM